MSELIYKDYTPSQEFIESHYYECNDILIEGIDYITEITIDDIRNFWLKAFGVENPAQLEEVKQTMKDTCQERYGVDYVFQSEEFKQNAKKTSLERYGVEFYSQTEEHKDRVKQTELERYGPKIEKEIKGNTSYIKGAAKRLSDPDFRKRLSKACKGKWQLVECPHCGKEGKGPNMTRYHFDKCKEKVKSSNGLTCISSFPLID